MTRRLIVLLVLVAASAPVLAAPAAATTPLPPPGPPSAYVQTAGFNQGCTDWSMRSTGPMSPPAPQWVTYCTNYDGYWTEQYSYYWNADLQNAVLFDIAGWDDFGDYYFDCMHYPVFVGACQA